MGTFRILVFTYPHHNLFAGPIGFKLRWFSMSCETLVLYRKRAFAEEDSGSKALWRAFDRAV